MIIFLDFDGVLHSNAVYRHPKKGVHLRDDGRLFQHAPLLVQALEPYSDVRIVLSTSWVQVLGFDRAKGYLPESLQERVIGATYHSAMRDEIWCHLTRFDQIIRYTRRHGVKDWIAIDDDAEGWPDSHVEHLVHTHDFLGIGEHQKIDRLKDALADWQGREAQ